MVGFEPGSKDYESSAQAGHKPALVSYFDMFVAFLITCDWAQ